MDLRECVFPSLGGADKRYRLSGSEDLTPDHNPSGAVYLTQVWDVCVCVCVCVCACVRACMYMHVCMCACMHAYVGVHMCVCTWVCMCIYVIYLF